MFVLFQTVLQQKQQAEATLISFTKRLNTSAAGSAAAKPDVNPFLAPPAVESSSALEEQLGLGINPAAAVAAGGAGFSGSGSREAVEGEGVAPSAQQAFSGLLASAAAAAERAGGGGGDKDGAAEAAAAAGGGGNGAATREADGAIGWKEAEQQQQQEQAAWLVGGTKPLGFTFNPLAAQQRLAVGVAGGIGGFVDAFEEKRVKEGLAGGVKRGRGAKYTEAELKMITAEEIFRDSEAALQRGAGGGQSGRGARREAAGVVGDDVEFMEIGDDEGGTL